MASHPGTGLRKIVESKENPDVKKTTFYKIEAESLKVIPGFNPRFETQRLRDHISMLKSVLKAGGRFKPIEVITLGKEIFMVDGHSRRRATLEAKAEGFDAPPLEATEFEGNPNDVKALKMKVFGSAESLPLPLLEQGMLFVSFVDDCGMARQEIADEARKSLSHVDQGLMLARASSECHEYIANGLISERVALNIIRKHKDGAAKVMKAIIEGSGAAKVTAKMVDKPVPPKVAARAFTAVSTWVDNLSAAEQKFIESSPEDETLRVSTAVLKELLAAHKELHAQPVKKAKATAVKTP